MNAIAAHGAPMAPPPFDPWPRAPRPAVEPPPRVTPELLLTMTALRMRVFGGRCPGLKQGERMEIACWADLLEAHLGGDLPAMEEAFAAAEEMAACGRALQPEGEA